MKNFELTEEAVAKWQEIVESEDAPILRTARDKRNMVMMLETAERVLTEDTNSSTGNTWDNGKWDPVLISMIRRTQAGLVTGGLIGVQPMSGPTGLIFCQKIHYVDPSDGSRTETRNQIAPIQHSGPMSTAAAEALGVDDELGGTGAAADPVVQTAPWNEMTFSIDKTTVTATSRALKARWTNELEQDLRALHGLNADSEMASILGSEVTVEIDREILNSMLTTAVDSGTFDLDTDTDGRWEVEKYKALVVKVERECHKIARGTRRGRGNFVITSPDVAAALNMAGKIDSTTALGDFAPPGNGLAFCGVLAGMIRVYVDPFAATNYILVGYRGPTVYDSGLFYCPYVAMEYYRARGEEDFDPRMGLKTRYGLVANPFAVFDGSGLALPDGSMLGNGNQYYRKFTVTNL